MKMQSFSLGVVQMVGAGKGTSEGWLGDKFKEAKRRRYGHDGGRGKIRVEGC